MAAIFAFASNSAFGIWNLIPPFEGLAIPTAATPSLMLGSRTHAGRSFKSPLLLLTEAAFFFAQEKSEVASIQSYLQTRFFRFLVSLRKNTQHATRSTYTWVPIQDWTRTWSDKDLYKKYELTKDEIAFIETMIRPMELEDE